MFMRDPCAVVNHGLVVGHMKYPARQRESLLMRHVYSAHPKIVDRDGTPPPLWFDKLSLDSLSNVQPENMEATIEGGDILVIRPDLLLVGVSERTSPQAVDELAKGLARQGSPVRTIYAVIMPRQRSTMHLDTIFTMLSHDDLLVYPPLIMPGGGEQVGLVRITIKPDGTTHLAAVRKSLVECLEDELERPLNPIFCGGNSRLYQEREQWTDGANAFAIAPGLILLYRRNHKTMEELSRRGWRILRDEDLATSHQDLLTGGPAVISLCSNELSRARGGPRCMTMPIERDPL
jgi:arginine deiminase